MKATTRYFSVFKSVRINGSVKRPAVCYPLTDDVAAGVKRMVAEKQARIYEEEVRFVSGAAVPVAQKSGDGDDGEGGVSVADRKARRAK